MELTDEFILKSFNILTKRIEELEKILSSNERKSVRKHEQKGKLCMYPFTYCPSKNFDFTCKLDRCIV